MLRRVYELRNEISLFMEQKGTAVPEFADPTWMCDFAFLVDVTAHLNQLNVQLQGREHLINDELFQFVSAFEMKLRLWETQLRNANYVHFPTLTENEPASPDTYVAFVELLRREFADRFTDIRAHSGQLMLFSNPFQVEADGAPEAVQMELIELQCSAALKATFKEVPLVEFYRMHLPTEQFPALIKHATIIASLFGSTYVCEQLFGSTYVCEQLFGSTYVCEQLFGSTYVCEQLFGSTYVCEQLFSKMNFTKCKTRTQLTDGHLDDAATAPGVTLGKMVSVECQEDGL